ncbi:uncharacterized protein [Euphorbia lathyris]|uniref:uncharacterized protein n=1 Tax=Euphorbia lathyris TaxID=212925 RepID=UPI0033144B45
MRGGNSTVSNVAQRCKSILASNWQARLNTVKADNKGSKDEIYSSKVKYILKKGKPFIWVPEKDMHNVNTIIDERASMAVASPFPGPLANILKSMKKLPARVALSGDVVALNDEKAELALESVGEVILSEQSVIKESPYTVSGVLSSSDHISSSRSECLMELLGGEKYRVYRFNISSCTLIDGFGRTHEVELEDMERSKIDPLASLSVKLIDGINQSEARRRALVLFCVIHMDANARDAYMVSVDCKGFEVLAKVPGPISADGIGECEWREFRFTFNKEAQDIETFCQRLVEMEEEVVKQVSGFSGLTLA